MAVRSAKDLGDLIRHHRRARGWTQADLAARCGTGERFIVELEGGKPTAHLGKALTAAYEVGLRLNDGETNVRKPDETEDNLSFLPKFE